MLFRAVPEPSWDTEPKLFVLMSWRSMRKKWMSSTNLLLIQRLRCRSFLERALNLAGSICRASTTTQMS
jgi:hypothetical protein